MSVTNDRADTRMPITAEVGGEGGSFADPTHQVATLHGNVGRYSTAMDEGSQPAASTDAANDMLRYPTEAPLPARRRLPWAAGLIGAAAGAVFMFALLKRGR